MKLLTTIALGALSLATAPAAGAQSWGGRAPGWGWHGPRYQPAGDWRVRQVCSGERAHDLEARLRREWQEHEIDPRQAERIHREIDKLERRGRDECAEGDWRAVGRIAGRYDEVQGWIGAEAHGRGW